MVKPLLPDQVRRRPSFSEDELSNCAKDTAGIIDSDVVAAVFQTLEADQVRWNALGRHFAERDRSDRVLLSSHHQHGTRNLGQVVAKVHATMLVAGTVKVSGNFRLYDGPGQPLIRCIMALIVEGHAFGNVAGSPPSAVGLVQ